MDSLWSPLGGRLTLLALALAVLGLIFFTAFLTRLGAFLRERSLTALRPIHSLIWLLFSLVFFASATAAGSLAMTLRTYRAFTDRTPVARIDCAPVTDNPDYQMILRYLPYENGQPGIASHYLLKGDQWEIGGDVLKWDPRLTWLGLRTCHKVTRISSHALDPQAELAGAHSSYQLHGGTDKFWLWLHRHGHRLPFVEAVYGSAVFTLPDEEQSFELLIGPDGYSLQKVPREGSAGLRTP
jgi:hypothetical protein